MANRLVGLVETVKMEATVDVKVEAAQEVAVKLQQEEVEDYIVMEEDPKIYLQDGWLGFHAHAYSQANYS